MKHSTVLTHNNSKDIYLEYIKKCYVQYKKKSGSWEGFLELYENIKKNGFDKNKQSISIKLVEKKWVCIHGRHRMCMLRYIYGHRLRLRFKKNYLVEISIAKNTK